MLLMNPHPYYIRINPFEDPDTIRRIESELRVRGGAAPPENGEKRYGFHSFTIRDGLLETLRAQFGRASVEGEDGPYYHSDCLGARSLPERKLDIRRRFMERPAAFL
ncbi:MAG: hypothetical protein P4L84_33985 [Isosphaeraceae bacterium]|nr:hypothetical protein [Isosphaeraceae bacterium]